MSPRKKPDYTGILNEPIVRPNFLYTEEEQTTYILQERIKKLGALRQLFGIKVDDDHTFLRLSLELARKHVPGFKVIQSSKSQAGRPSEKIDDIQIYAVVKKQLKASGNNNVSAAVNIIAKTNPHFSDFRDNPESLRTRYSKIINPKRTGLDLVKLVRKIAVKRYNLTEDQLNEIIIETIELLPARKPKTKHR